MGAGEALEERWRVYDGLRVGMHCLEFFARGRCELCVLCILTPNFALRGKSVVCIYRVVY